MNDKDHAVIEALGRVNRFAVAHLAAFPAGSKAVSDFARAAQIEKDLVPSDSTPGIAASPATGARNHLFDELWDDLLAIAATARTIAREEPGFSTDFRVGEDTHREIVATATDFLKHLADPAIAAKFVAYSLPADFVEDLRKDLEALGDKQAEQTDDRLGDIVETAATRQLVKEARDLIRSLDTSVKNCFRRDPTVLAEWLAASRIRRTGGGGGGGGGGESGGPDDTLPPAPPAQ